MPRSRRLLPGGYVYHVINRGNNRQRAFHDDTDYGQFLKTMHEAQQQVDLVHLGELEQLSMRVRDAKEDSPRYKALKSALRDGYTDGELFDFALVPPRLALSCQPEHSAKWQEFIADFNAAAKDLAAESE